MSKTKPIEQATAETILQQPEAVEVGGKTYMIAPPSIATLVLASRSIAELPHVRLDQERVLESSLAIAKNCENIGYIAATLILGAKRCFETKTIVRKASRRILWGLFRLPYQKAETITRREALARELMENLTPQQMHELIGQALLKMQVGDFFGLTTFLTEINLTKPTKVETGATAPGR